jgi:hypothetical protein
VRRDEEDGEDSVLYGEMGFTPEASGPDERAVARVRAVKAAIPRPTPVPLAAAPEKAA